MWKLEYKNATSFTNRLNEGIYKLKVVSVWDILVYSKFDSLFWNHYKYKLFLFFVIYRLAILFVSNNSFIVRDVQCYTTPQVIQLFWIYLYSNLAQRHIRYIQFQSVVFKSFDYVKKQMNNGMNVCCTAGYSLVWNLKYVR